MNQRLQQRSYNSKSPVSRPNHFSYLSPFSKQNYELGRLNSKMQQINRACTPAIDENLKTIDTQPLQFSCQRKVKQKQPQLVYKISPNNENSSIFLEKNEANICLTQGDQNKKKRYLSVVSEQQKSRFSHINFRYEEILKEIKMIKSEKDMDRVVFLYKQKQQQLEKKCKSIERQRGYWIQMYLRQKEKNEGERKIEEKLRQECYEYLSPNQKQVQNNGLIGMVQQIVKLIKLWQNEMSQKSKQNNSLVSELQVVKQKNESVNKYIAQLKAELEKQKKQKAKLLSQVLSGDRSISITQQNFQTKQPANQIISSCKISKPRSVSASGNSHARKHHRHRNGDERRGEYIYNIDITRQRQVQNYKESIKKLDKIVANQNQDIISEGLKKLNNKYRLKMYQYQGDGKQKVQKSSIIEQLKYIKDQKYKI